MPWPDTHVLFVLQADVVLLDTQRSCLQSSLSTYISTLRDVTQRRRAAAAILSSLAVNRRISTLEALSTRQQARELLDQLNQNLDEEQLALARLHMVLFMQVRGHVGRCSCIAILAGLCLNFHWEAAVDKLRALSFLH
jgi:hypothetical protein